MKKLFIVSVAVLGLSAMTSCTKDYTCTCEVLGITTTTPFNDVKKADADDLKTSCEATGICTWAVK